MFILFRNENSPMSGKYTNPDVQRLFFLSPAPDGTNGTLATVAIQNLRGGEYASDTSFLDSDSDVSASLPFLKGLSAELVEERVREDLRLMTEC